MKRRSSEERASLVEKFRRSGQTQRAFAALEGISEHTLSNWLNHPDRRGEEGFVEVPAVGRTEVELRFPDGTMLLVRG